MTGPTREEWANGKRRRTDRFIIWYLSFSALILAALAVAVVVLLFQNSRNIADQKQNNIRQCQIANVTRLQDIAIWNRLLKVGPGATAAQKAEVADLNRLIAVKDTPRDCAAAYSGG